MLTEPVNSVSSAARWLCWRRSSHLKVCAHRYSSNINTNRGKKGSIQSGSHQLCRINHNETWHAAEKDWVSSSRTSLYTFSIFSILIKDLRRVYIFSHRSMDIFNRRTQILREMCSSFKLIITVHSCVIDCIWSYIPKGRWFCLYV